MINKKIISLLFLFSLFPLVSSAQYTGATNRLSQLLLTFGGLMNSLIPVIFGLSLVYFFWGTANFILNSNNEKTRKDNLNKLIFGVVALFVFVSIYGILGVLQDLVNL